MGQRSTIRSALAWGCEQLAAVDDEHPRQSAEWLLAWACALPRLELYLDLDRPLGAEELSAYRAAISRRAGGEPLQYITGMAPFRYLTMTVAPGVLIPRPETEILVSEFLRLLPAPTDQNLQLADIGTGSGNIACALATERPDARVLAIDISPEALAIARDNVTALDLDDRVTVVEGDLVSVLAGVTPESLDGVISNPPYVPTRVLGNLPREVAAFEPSVALDGGEDGLDVFRQVLTAAHRVLVPKGLLAVELYEDALDEAALLARDAGFTTVTVHQDLTGRPRVLTAMKAR